MGFLIIEFRNYALKEAQLEINGMNNETENWKTTESCFTYIR